MASTPCNLVEIRMSEVVVFCFYKHISMKSKLLENIYKHLMALESARANAHSTALAFEREEHYHDLTTRLDGG